MSSVWWERNDGEHLVVSRVKKKEKKRGKDPSFPPGRKNGKRKKEERGAECLAVFDHSGSNRKESHLLRGRKGG